MKFITFRDSCIIERDMGIKDEYDNPTRALIYEGECLYEEGGSGYARSIITRNPTLFIPGNDVLVMINDAVTIVTEQGREIRSIVSIVRDVNMPWRTNVKVTKIELKQAHGE